MSKLLVLAGGVVKAPKGAGLRAVSAYVALSAGEKSRVFRVRGSPDAPVVEEMSAATTLDIRRFQNELQNDLQSALDELRTQGHPAHVELSRPHWVCSFVKRHLKATEGVDVD
jgi:hypothetical protein